MFLLINNIKVLFRRLNQKGSFAQNFAITFSGSALITIIGFILTPVMSRIYSPQEYGIFSVINSIIGNLNVFSSLTYLGAFLLEKNIRKFYSLVQLTLILNFVTCFLLVASLIFFKVPFLSFFNIISIDNWIYTIPLLLLIANLNSIMNNWLLRDKRFKERASVDVGSSLVGRVSSIGYGYYISNSFSGLIIGDFLLRAFKFIGFLKSGIYTQLPYLFSGFSINRIKNLAIKYKDFPLYQLPTNYFNLISLQLPIFVLASYFGSTTVGLYGFSVNLLGIPLNLMERTVAPVFYQKAAEVYLSDKTQLKKITSEIYDKLIYISIVPFSIITVFGDVIFKLAFGAKWEMAGVFTAYLGFSYVFKLIVNCFSGVFAIVNKQRLEFICNFIGLILRSCALFIGIYFNDLNLAVLAFGIASFISYFIISMLLFKIIGVKIWAKVIKTLVLIALSFIFFKGIRIFAELLI
ncbi:oligosaccharide flippase family protein [Adhaeribacter terreus]|uniref:Oligosaccharide flippase family protein n=1 Tax=Adhaeribacter terreus TaxID=529703 RepID=A0ABW0E4U1_9BACT